MSITYITRRSLRLLLNGHYNPDKVPTISHKETRVKPTKKRRKKLRVNTELAYAPVEACVDYSNNENQRRNILKPVFWSAFILSLFCGCFCLVAALYPLSMEYLVRLRTTDMAVTPACKEQENPCNELQEKLLTLEKKLDYLLPSADLMPNFALKSLGAFISGAMTSSTYRTKGFFWGFFFRKATTPPDIVIEGRSHLLPGQCWSFEGSEGHISIALPFKVAISHVSLGHIPKHISPDGTISSAPRLFAVYGKKGVGYEERLLGTFLYDEAGDPLQIFKIPDHKTDSFRYITLQVKSNWGHPDFTSLYTFRVHGKLEE